MKKYFFSAVPLLIFMLSFSSCFHDHNISVSINDDEDEYEMDASFQRKQTHAVQVYLNDNLLVNGSEWHRNDEVEKEITLDDNTTFYIDASPGELRIKIDKTENSEQSCEKLRQVCEDIKDLLADNN